MANTKSAQKAARQTIRRTAVNKSRRSDMRTYVRKVEEALASKDPKAAAEALGEETPSRPGGAEGHRAQERHIAENLAPDQAGQGPRRLIAPSDAALSRPCVPLSSTAHREPSSPPVGEAGRGSEPSLSVAGSFQLRRCCLSVGATPTPTRPRKWDGDASGHCR